MIFSLEDNGVITECQLQTLSAFETLDFQFVTNEITGKVILKVREFYVVVIFLIS